MKLLTQEMLAKFEKINKMSMMEKEAYDRNPEVIAKFFHPWFGGTWFATEYAPKTRCFFGFVTGVGRPEDDEWGYFSLDELEDLKIHGCPTERDLYFDNPHISDVKEIKKIEGFHKAREEGPKDVWRRNPKHYK